MNKSNRGYYSEHLCGPACYLTQIKMITMMKTASILFVLLLCSLAAAATATAEGECNADDGSCMNPEESNSFEFATTVPETGQNANSNCQDKEEACAGWARMGECDANPDYMLSE